jgi:predicted metal-dependent phosphoesterase TrpH
MTLSTSNLVLAPDAAIDLQLHTTYSDGIWTPAQLLDHLVSEQFALVAVTDHDRPDTAVTLQHMALHAHLPVLVAAEMTTSWHGQMVDVLCYGFRLDQHALTELAQDLARRQSENTHAVYQKLCRSGYLGGHQSDELGALLATPSAQQPHALVALVEKHGFGTDKRAAAAIVRNAGTEFATTDIATVVDAAHQSGAVCLIAHPGRDDGFVCFDGSLLDQLRQDIPIDGLEVYYPAHTPEQTALYREYARRSQLLISAGSDSHEPSNRPIKYRADLSRELLERMGIQVLGSRSR